MFKVILALFFAIVVVAALMFFFPPAQAGIGAVLAVVIFRICSVVTEPKTKVLVANIFGETRQAGPGWVFLFRPFEWIATVNGVTVHSVQNQVLDVKLDVEAENEEFVTLDMAVIYRIMDLVRYLDFTLEDFRESIKEHAKSFATDIGRGCKDLDEIYERVKDDRFEAGLLSGFRELMPSSDITVEGHHGIKVVSVIISDPELPEEVKKAAQEKLVAQKRAKAQLEEIKGLDKSAKLLRGKEKNPSMEKEKALQIVQQQFGKVTKHNEEFGFAPDTLKTIEKVPGAGIPAWALAILRQIGGGRGGQRGGGGKNKKGGQP